VNEERMKILQMLADHVITAQGANQLLEALHSDDVVEGEFVDNDEDREHEKQARKANGFDENLKEQMRKMKEDLKIAKDKLAEEIRNINAKDIEDNLRKGMEEVEEAMKEADRVISQYGNKIISKFKSKKEDDEDGRKNEDSGDAS
jgi:hypothetical protein